MNVALNPEEYIESEPLNGVSIHENDILVSKKDKRRLLREVNSLRQWPSRRIPYEIDPDAAFGESTLSNYLFEFHVEYVLKLLIRGSVGQSEMKRICYC